MFAANLSKPGFQYKYFLYAGIISVGYLLLSFLLIGFKPEQLILVVMFDLLYLIAPATRRLVLGFSIYIVFWILFDYMKAFPNYNFNAVHIESLYNAEKRLFGISQGGAFITPNEYWALHRNSFLNVICGFFYLCWIPVPLLFAAYLYYKNRPLFFRFSFTFLLVNILGFIVYYIYPAAPPWYVQLHGFRFEPHTPGNTAGLGAFDKFFGVNIFGNLYSKSSNVFAAMPSLHASYPLLSLYYGIRARMSKATWLFAFVTGGIWFTAVYSGHHYVLDVLAGITCAATGIMLFNAAARKWNWFPLTGAAGATRMRVPANS